MRSSSRARINKFFKLPLLLIFLLFSLGTCEDEGGDCGGGDCGGGECESVSDSPDYSDDYYDYSDPSCDCDSSYDYYDYSSSSSSCVDDPDPVCYECASYYPVYPVYPVPPVGAPPPPPPSPPLDTLLLVTRNANNPSSHASLSNAARLVAFDSLATSLASGDYNNASDVFLFDRVQNRVQLLSRNALGRAGNGPSTSPSVSASGDVIVFESAATDLAPSDPNGALTDLFVYERPTGVLLRMNLATDGFGPNGGISEPRVSADGATVVFSSASTNLIAGDPNGTVRDIFMVTLATGAVRIVSVSQDSGGANGPSASPDVSSSGRYVVFESEASNLVPYDGNGSVSDIFLYDTQALVMRLVSLTNEDAAADGASHAPTISANGRMVAFHSDATNLGRRDPNGAVRDVLQYDRFFDEVTLVLPPPAWRHGANGESGYPRYSEDGEFLVFESFASNLVAGDTNGRADVFVYHQVFREARLVSVRGIIPGNDHSLLPAISPEGDYIAFESFAANLHSLDRNGDTADILLAKNPAE